MSGKHLKLGAFLTATGQHIAAWRHPRVLADGGVNLEEYVKIARIAERGLFDLMFLADNAGIWDTELVTKGRSPRVGYFEPITLLSAIAARTTKLGLIATATTTFNEPYNIARKYASLDHLSAGRAGWNLVTSANEAEAYNFGLTEHMDHAERYERAAEFAEVVLGLWNSWDDDAFPMDKESGLFFDPEKLHVLNHVGKYFSVRGPLNVPRPPQGRPIIVQAGSSPIGMDLAARYADIVFTAQVSLEAGAAFYSKQKDLMAKYGRLPDQLKIMPGLSPIVAATRAEAEEKFDELQSLIDPVVAISLLSDMAGVDMSVFDENDPFPTNLATNANKSRLRVMEDRAAAGGLTIRQLATQIAGTRGHNFVVGTPADVADCMEAWFRQGAADGFNVMPQTLPGGLEDFVDMVIPELQRRGLFRTAYEGTTLRDHLGLKVA